MTLDGHGRLNVSEAAVQRACMELLRMEGWIVRPAPRQGHRTRCTAYEVPAGEPDLLAVRPSDPRGLDWRVLLVECKTRDGRLSAAQRVWAEAWGVPVHVVRSVEEVRELLSRTARSP